MRKILIPLTAVAAMAAAAPAYADHDRYGHGRYYDAGYNRGGGSWLRSVETRGEALRRAAYEGRRSGYLDTYTANSIMGKVGSTVNLARQYRRGGVTPREMQAIDNRFAEQEYRLRAGPRYNDRYRW